jgi:hypothetical protein
VNENLLVGAMVLSHHDRSSHLDETFLLAEQQISAGEWHSSGIWFGIFKKNRGSVLQRKIQSQVRGCLYEPDFFGAMHL